MSHVYLCLSPATSTIPLKFVHALFITYTPLKFVGTRYFASHIIAIIFIEHVKLSTWLPKLRRNRFWPDFGLLIPKVGERFSANGHSRKCGQQQTVIYCDACSARATTIGQKGENRLVI